MTCSLGTVIATWADLRSSDKSHDWVECSEWQAPDGVCQGSNSGLKRASWLE